MKSYAIRSAQQMRCPSGFMGRLAARVMKKYNAEAESWTVEQLKLAPDDRVLEIGFGPGIGLRSALCKIQTGFVGGIDLSPDMVKMVSRNNKEAIQNGRLRLTNGDAEKLPFEDRSFSKVFAVNVIYFWKEPRVPFLEIKRVLTPGGQFCIYMVEKQDMLRLDQARTDVFNLLEKEEVLKIIEAAGFLNCVIQTRQERIRTGVCISGVKKE
jgi:ubiquinone/menaquinone biosynthesis C-methylase UbiE